MGFELGGIWVKKDVFCVECFYFFVGEIKEVFNSCCWLWVCVIKFYFNLGLFLSVLLWLREWESKGKRYGVLLRF